MIRLRRFAAALALATVAFAGVASAADQPAKLRKVTVAAGSTSFAWLPLYVADGAGYFAKEGLEVETISVGANTTPVAAILSNSADIAGIGTQAAFAAIDKGQTVKIFTAMTTEFSSVIFGRKDAFAAHGVDERSPLRDRVAALRDMKLGVISIGAGSELLFRFLFSHYAEGVDYGKVNLMVVGDASKTLAAMSKGLIEVGIFSPPVPQKAIADGYGAILIDPIRGDVPETRGMIFTALAVTPERVRKDGPMLESFARAIERADRLIHNDTAAAGRAARKMMSQIESDLYDAAVKAMVSGMPKTAVVSIDGLRRNHEFLEAVGLKYKVDVADVTVNDLVARAIATMSKN